MSSPEKTLRSNANFGATGGRGAPLPRPVDQDTRPRSQPAIRPARPQDPAIKGGLRGGRQGKR